MITLVAMMTYDNASTIQRAIGNHTPSAWVFFFFFMIIISIGMMELMTSLFIDSLLEEKRKMEMKETREKKIQRTQVEDLMAGLFAQFDADDNGELDKEELGACMKVFLQDDTRELMEYVGIDAGMMAEAIEVADINADGSVTEPQFRVALDSVSQPAKKADIRGVHQRVAVMGKKVDRIQLMLEKLLEANGITVD